MNKGFTLVELLAVMLIISLLLIISIPGLTVVYKEIRRDNYKSKISYINSSAHKYASSIKDEIQKSGCKDTTISELIKKGYITSESKEKDEIINPTDNTPMNGKVRMCYCSSTLDLKINYYILFDEKKVYYIDDVVLFNDKLYKCSIKYNNNGGINSTLKGKRYFEEIGC